MLVTPQLPPCIRRLSDPVDKPKQLSRRVKLGIVARLYSFLINYANSVYSYPTLNKSLAGESTLISSTKTNQDRQG